VPAYETLENGPHENNPASLTVVNELTLLVLELVTIGENLRQFVLNKLFHPLGEEHVICNVKAVVVEIVQVASAVVKKPLYQLHEEQAEHPPPL
jgi:enhancing lycopene biosynthesis protein 2